MKSSNPVLTRSDVFTRTPSVGELEQMYAVPGRMTVDDVVMRTAAMLAVLAASGAVAWTLDLGRGAAIGAGIAGFVVAMVITFKKVTNPGLILTYAALEGVFLGAISHAFNTVYPGIVVQAVIGTGTAFAGMLIAYRSGRIRVTPKFTKVAIGAGIGLIGLMVVNLIGGLIGGGDGLGLRSGGPLAILFSLVAIGVACMFLAMDFDMVEKLIAAGASEREAWLASFGLVMTLVWLYVEILRLISYFRD